MKEILNYSLFFEDLVYLLKGSKKTRDMRHPNVYAVKVPRDKFVTNFTDDEIRQAIPEIIEFISSNNAEAHPKFKLVDLCSFDENFLLIFTHKECIDYMESIDYDSGEFVRNLNL